MGQELTIASWLHMLLLCPGKYTTCFVLPLSFCSMHTQTHIHTCPLIIHWELTASARESFILKLLKGLVSRRIAQWTSLLVNMSNASVAAPEIIHGYSVMTVTYATPVLSLLKSPASVGLGRCGELFLICMSVCVGGRGGSARVRHWRGVGIPRRKSVEICRAERISDSLLGQTDGCREKGGGRRKPHDGGENDLWEASSEQERRAGGRGVGDGRGWGGGNPQGEAQRGIQSQVTFSRESSCEHSAPGRRVTVESCESYTAKPRFSRAAFTLHRSAITKPIKKPEGEASAVSQSPLADLATRITAQETTFQHRT